jgi:hypothetical protein
MQLSKVLDAEGEKGCHPLYIANLRYVMRHRKLAEGGLSVPAMLAAFLCTGRTFSQCGDAGCTIPCDNRIYQDPICYYELADWTRMRIQNGVFFSDQSRCGNIGKGATDLVY